MSLTVVVPCFNEADRLPADEFLAWARDRDDRYANAGELARDLDAFLRGRLVGAYRYTSWELLTRFVRRNRALSATLASLVVLAIVAVAFVVRQQRIGEQERQRAVAAEARARAQERETHERLVQVHWQNATRRLQRGGHDLAGGREDDGTVHRLR